MFFFVVLYILECITAFSTFRAGIVLDDLKLINSVFNKWVLVFFFPFLNIRRPSKALWQSLPWL